MSLAIPSGSTWAARGANAQPERAGPPDTTSQLNWDGFSLGKIPLDQDSLRIEMRRSYAGVDQEMLREMAQRDAQTKDVTNQIDHGKQQSEVSAKRARRDFSIVENIKAPAPPASLAATGTSGGGRAEEDDLLASSMGLSIGFNEIGARFSV